MPDTIFELRPITAADTPFLKILFAACHPELAAVPLPAGQVDALLDMQFHMQHNAYRQYQGIEFLLIVQGDEPIGRFSVQRSPARHALVDIALLPGWRGCGIGAAVISCFLQEAADAGCGVQLHVARGNQAWRLYARLGFQVTADDGAMLRMEKSP
ncbi:MAG: GNAT family N-acetyltransferase [Burkholderiaceae bacterium]|nr:GNAT family N-acetyltransferase [Burkholderiaceae bacterium]